MKIALAQLNSTDDITTNLQTIASLVNEAAEQTVKSRLIVFPENSLYFRVNTTDLPKTVDDPAVWTQLQRQAKNLHINIHLTTALSDVDGKIYNASVLIGDDGTLKIIYRKVHLFDIALTGQQAIRESDVFTGGSAPSTFLIDDIKFGNSVCYDIRFSELYASYAKQEVDVILVPAAFLVKTGEAHWDVLLRARAIESQCYILAPAQAGTHRSNTTESQRETYGNTVAVGPWGEVLERKVSGVGLIFVEVNKQAIETVRQQIPMKSHRRL